MSLLTRLEKSRSFWFLLIISPIFFLLRIPSLFEPYWYGDEGIYQALGILMRAGHPLYSGAWDNKPPLLYVIYAIFNSDQFMTRLASLVFGVFSIWVFYFLAKKLFQKEKSAIITTSVYAILFGIKLLEGNIANAENFMLFPIILSALLIYSIADFKQGWQKYIYFFAGSLLGLAFLTKTVAAFDFLAFSGFLFIFSSGFDISKIKQTFKTLFPLALGFLTPIAGTFAYYFLTHNFKDFFQALLFSNVGYVGYANKLIIPQGFLILKSTLLGLFVLGLYIKRNTIPRNILFILIWLGFSLFNALFSQRPYTHYLLVLLPSFCLILGLIFSEKRRAILGFITLTIVLILITKNFNLNGRFLEYYTNFIAFSFGKKDVTSYQNFFDKNTARDYELARYIRTNTNENETILVWGNNAQIYKLSGKVPIFRYTVAYHITNFKGAILEMDQAVEKEEPKLIILMPNVAMYPLSLANYSEKIDIKGAKIYEKVL